MLPYTLAVVNHCFVTARVRHLSLLLCLDQLLGKSLCISHVDSLSCCYNGAVTSLADLKSHLQGYSIRKSVCLQPTEPANRVTIQTLLLVGVLVKHLVVYRYPTYLSP